MARTCSICIHPKRKQIEAMNVAGNSAREIAAKFGTKADAVRRHLENHIAAQVQAAQAAQAEKGGATLLEKVAGLERDAKRLGKLAEDERDFKTALASIRELTRLIELVARLAGELDTGVTVNLVQSQDWLRLRGQIMTALKPYPDAREAVVRALASHGVAS